MLQGFIGIYWFLWDTLVRVDHFVAAVHFIIIRYTQREYYLSYTMPTIALCLSICLNAMLNLVYDFQLRKSSEKINKQQVEKFILLKKRKTFQSKAWEELEVGDIIKVYKNQELPADVLILDISGHSNEQFCHVTGGLLADIQMPQLKRSHQGTSNKTSSRLNDSKLVEQLSGILKWECSSNGSFTGTLKLNENPSAFEIKLENIILRGSRIYHTQDSNAGVLCLVLNVGADCMLTPNRKSLSTNNKLGFWSEARSKRGNQFSQQVNLLTVLHLAATFIVPLIFAVIKGFILQNSGIWDFARTYAGESNTFDMYISSLNYFFCNFPYLMHVTFEMIALMHALFIKWDLGLVPADVRIHNLSTVPKLGLVNNIFLSRSALFNTQSSEVVSVNFSSHQFFNEADTDIQMTGEAAHNHSDSDSDPYDETQDTIDYLPNELKKNRNFTNKELTKLTELSSSQHSIQLNELLKAVTLCHSSTCTSKQNPDEVNQVIEKRSDYQSLYKQEKAQLQFAKAFGYRFASKNKRTITIYCNQQQLRYQELSYTEMIRDNQTINVQIVNQYGTGQYKMFVKGPLSELKQMIYSEYSIDYEAELIKFVQKGITAIVFAERNLDGEEEAMMLVKHITEMQNQNKDSAFITAELLQWAEQVQYLGIIGLKKHCNLRKALVMEEAFRNEVKVWMVTDADEMTTLTDCNQLKVLQNCNQPLNVKGNDEREIEVAIKANLRQLVERRPNQQGASSSDRKSQKDFKETRSVISKRRKKKAEGLRENKDVVFFNGNSLRHILKDETIKKTFLLLCSMCSYMIGSEVTASQKADLVQEIRAYNNISDLGHVLGVVSGPMDQYLIDNADITVGINTKFQKSDCLNSVDIQMQDLYGLSYLMFKHGTIYQRRIANTQGLFNYRTLLFDLIGIIFFAESGLSGTSFLPNYWHAIYICILSPIYFFVSGTFFKDIAFDYMNRIFGEYRGNFACLTTFHDYSHVFAAIFDACLVLLIYMQSTILRSETPRNTATNQHIEFDTLTLHTMLVVNAVLIIRMNTRLSVTIAEILINNSLTLVMLLFLLEYGDTTGINDILKSPQLILHLIWIVLTMWVTNHVYYVFVHLLPTQSNARLQFYKQIEERLLFEEYEDPSQEFKVDKREPYFAQLERCFNQKRMLGINKNMMKLHRSDSLDEILEKINQGDAELQGGKKQLIDNTANQVDRVSLKLNDINKELEYGTQVRERKIIQTSIKKIYLLLALFAVLLFEVTVYKVASNSSSTQTEDDDKITLKLGMSINMIYIDVSHIVVALLCVFLVLKAKDLRADIVLFAYIVLINVLMIVQLLVEPLNPINDFVFAFVVAFSFINRQYAVYFVGIVCVSTTLTFATVRYNTQVKTVEADESKVKLYIQSLMYLTIVFLWVAYAYNDELRKKLQFVSSLRKSKEYTKLLQIINILIPSLVRDRIKEGQKNFSDSQGEVTIIFIDIAEFDQIVSSHTGKELIELLDRLYNAFDQLCEQYGLTKIETVGKTYMACGGLKFFESQIDQRLLSNHHSVRCMDFALEAVAVADKKPLKNGQKCTLKIGIHTGDVISGVVGDTKPQFSLIGETVNKTSRVCSKCPPRSVTVSKETHKYLCDFSNNFHYSHFEAEMKGIGIERLYKVSKKHRTDFKNRKLLPKHQKHDSMIKRQDKQKTFGKQKQLDVLDEMDGSQSQRSNMPVENSSEKYESIQNSGYAEEDEDEKKSNEESEDEDEALMLQQINFAQFKDDRVIAKNPSLNARYNLVERPRFLLQFDLADKENEFCASMLRQHKDLNMLLLIVKSIYDGLLGLSLALDFLPTRLMWVSIFWFIGFFVLQLSLKWFMERSATPDSNWQLKVAAVLNFGVSTVLCLLPYIYNRTDLNRNLTKVQVVVLFLMLFMTKSYPVKISFFLFDAILVALIAVEIMKGVWNKVDVLTLLTNIVIMLFCFVQLFSMMFTREMAMRKQYNRERIIDVEIEKNNELLSKLVPQHVLQGLKNDERIVEEINNVTLLYTDMVGFTAFSKAVKNPKEVLKLLSQLFSKFDQLVDQTQVYKVHTIGDCYVVMGYTGSVSKHRRTEQMMVEEAYRVVSVGFEMIDIIRKVSEETREPTLRNLKMRIGIHTGKIVGGIIGTKVVRYDIFGNDVLIANKMESNGVDMQVVISEATFNLLNKNQAIMETMDFTEHKQVEIPSLSKTVASYLVERIVQAESSSSYNSEDDNDLRPSTDPTTKTTRTPKEDNEEDQESENTEEN